jgi:hypothetical protein
MFYPALLRNQIRQSYRSFRSRHHVLVGILLALLLAYIVAATAAAGYFLPELSRVARPGMTPLEAIEAHLFGTLLSLFALRFFLQRTPRLKVRPFLHLPLSRTRLVRYFQISTLASPHNVLPAIFALALTHRLAYSGLFDTVQGVIWLVGLLAVLAISNYLNVLLRLVYTGSRVSFFVIGAALTAWVALDVTPGVTVTTRISSLLFGPLLHGDAVLMGLYVTAAATLFLLSSVAMEARLLDEGTHRGGRGNGSLLAFAPDRSLILNLLVLELKMIWRNRRPRMYLLFAVVFGVLYVGLLLVGRTSEGLGGVLAAMMASSMFVANYGQLMFSWESPHFDGLATRDLDMKRFVNAKLLLLQASCLAFFIVTLPLFAWWAPALIPLDIAFLFYNAGVTSTLMMVLALGNRKRIDPERGGMMNYEGFSMAHWFWFVFTMIPPVLLLYFLRNAPQTALLVLGGLGVGGLLSTRFWSEIFASHLARRKYSMAAGFRQYEH